MSSESDSDCESVSSSASDCGSISSLASECGSVSSSASDCESVSSFASECESISSLASECESVSSLASDCESISSSDSVVSSVHESESAFTFTRRFALIFGNNAYRSRALKSCHKDARDVATALEVLGKSIGSLFGKVKHDWIIVGFICIVVLDAIKRHMEIEMEKICKEIRENDCLVIYYSGHGKEENVREKDFISSVSINICFSLTG